MIANKLLGFSLAALLAFNVNATVVTYETTNLGAGVWQYDYSVKNDTLSSPIEEITIYFSLGLYSNLLSVFAPQDWDSLVAQPDQSLPADGFLDSLALATGILSGHTIAPFAVQFTWLGSGVPASQPFEVIDPISFSVSDVGNTTAYSQPPSVPEPGTMSLYILGIAVLLQLSLHRRLSKNSLSLWRTIE